MCDCLIDMIGMLIVKGARCDTLSIIILTRIRRGRANNLMLLFVLFLIVLMWFWIELK